MFSSAQSGSNPPAKAKRTYQKTPAPLPPVSLPPPPPPDAHNYRLLTPIHGQGSMLPLPQDAPAPFSHEQPRMRAKGQSQAQKEAVKFEAMEKLLKNLPFDNLGDFLATLFYNRPHGEPDRRGPTHATMVGTVDLGEPSDDGEDRSNDKLNSGSSFALSTDPETGRIEHFDDDGEEEENPNEPPDDEVESPDPKLNPYLDEEVVHGE
ncbi:hypothetical protein GGX14DRAFT_596100 [Mycena pura]|uniref:Uncharacterized protein n=1 Tax=Mycena pura TaxID=153505 RepID=A0AAD6XZM9_9AGAR|nr:hypothetical protein GGX14DRAFT_596100 [Mycena pura]